MTEKATGRSVRIFRGGTELKGCNIIPPENGSEVHQYDGCTCPCHQVIQPGLVPCPQCEHSDIEVRKVD
jgi:hypothetical protein